MIDVGLANAVMVFFVALVAMLLFAAATQGSFIAKNRVWETVVIRVIVFTLFRPGDWLDMWQDPSIETSGADALQVIGDLAPGATARLVISAPDFDTGTVGTTTLQYTAEAEGSGEERLQTVGLSVFEEDGLLKLHEPFPGTPYFEKLVNEYDFYGDEPALLAAVQVENQRPPKEIFFIPAFLLPPLIVFVQRPRATQAPF